MKSKVKGTIDTNENAIEGRRITAPLDMTQHRDPRVLLELLHHDLADLFGGDGVAVPIHGTFCHNNNVEALAGQALLRAKIY
jgi:hypothetical protein